MAILTRAEAAQYLSSHDRFAIITHRRPDGDTLGTGALLCRGLRQLGKTAHLLENKEITPRYAHLHQGLTKQAPEAGDTIVCVDVAAPGMLPACWQDLSIDLRIDHHGHADSFTADELVDPDAASCGEIVYDVLMQLYLDMDIPMANALYTAVATDTGCFRYANTTSHSFATAAACAWVSSDIYALNQALFDTVSLPRLRLQSYLTESALFFGENQLVICALPRAKELELGLTEDDMENISGFPRSIAGVKIAATIRQDPAGLLKISVRAVPGYDAGAICAKFGGGGHKGAAGANMNCSMEEAVAALKEAMEESLKKA